MTSRPLSEFDSELMVLVVDDAEPDRRTTEGIVASKLGWRVEFARDGASALAAIEREKPRVILTELRLPDMDGLDLVKTVRRKFPSVPVVVMTAFGNESLAIQALRDGAAGYVPKQALEIDLAPTLEQVVAAALSERRHQHLLERLAHTEAHFILDNDRVLIPSLVALVQEHVVRLGICDQTERIRVGVAIEEALLNAIFHGNLEVSSALRRDGDEPYVRLAKERRRLLPYRDRRIHFTYRISRTEAAFVIRDEGPGFDPAALPDPTDLVNLETVGGRGLLLIRSFMDEVSFNNKGNQITLLKRTPAGRNSNP